MNFLLAHRGESSVEGEGYFDIGKVLALFEDVFDDREDFIRTVNRLVGKQLVETNSRSTETIDGASHVRITSAGWYYMRYLIHSFPYLDLVLQDTPLNDSIVERELRDLVFKVDNLKDKEDEKEMRMAIRFGRVNRFLEYLQAEEDAEFAALDLDRLNSLVAARFMPRITEEFESQATFSDELLKIERGLLKSCRFKFRKAKIPFFPMTMQVRFRTRRMHPFCRG